MTNKYLREGSNVQYQLPELYQLRNKRTGHKIVNCTSRLECKRQLAAIKRIDWKLAKDLVITKLDRKEELQWISN